MSKLFLEEFSSLSLDQLSTLRADVITETRVLNKKLEILDRFKTDFYHYIEFDPSGREMLIMTARLKKALKARRNVKDSMETKKWNVQLLDKAIAMKKLIVKIEENDRSYKPRVASKEKMIQMSFEDLINEKIENSTIISDIIETNEVSKGLESLNLTAIAKVAAKKGITLKQYLVRKIQGDKEKNFQKQADDKNMKLRKYKDTLCEELGMTLKEFNRHILDTIDQEAEQMLKKQNA